MKLPQSFINDILSRIDIIEIIAQRVTLKQAGNARNYQAPCPFHQEKTPSFTVSQIKQFYYCFGCKASGNAIGFLMAYDKLSFIDSVKLLASHLGIRLPEVNMLEAETEKPNLLLLEQSAMYFQNQLKQHKAAQYYLKTRQLTSEIISTFKIGYAQAGWDNLLKSLGKSLDVKKKLADIGMLVEKDQRFFDRFRDRIMFPIRNSRGQIIAFGGRSLDQQMPKYLNSPDSSLFHKSKELYGLYEALQASRESTPSFSTIQENSQPSTSDTPLQFNKPLKQLIIVEGYLDVIALYQHGITYSVATLGTAINIHHLTKVLRYTQEIIFCFDGDLAGRKAAWKALEITLPLMNDGTNATFFFLPDNEDPDTFIRKIGTKNFLEKLRQAIPLADFFFQKLKESTEITTLAGKARLASIVKQKLEKLPKGIFKELMHEKLAQLIGLNIKKLETTLAYSPKRNQPILEQSISTGKIPSPILLAISLLLQCPQLLESLVIPTHFDRIQLEGIGILKQVMGIIYQHSTQTTGSLLEYLKGEEEKHLLAELASQDLLISDEAWQNELQGAFKRILDIDVERQIQKLLSKGRQEGLSFDEKTRLQGLLAERNNIALEYY